MNRRTTTAALADLEDRPVASRLNAGVAHQGVAKSLQFLRKNCGQPISVLDLARVSGLSRRGFQKAFLKHTGSLPGRTLRYFRIQRARELLAGSRLKLKSIAAKSGYRKTNSFWIAFRQVTGVPPKRFQNQVRPAPVRERRIHALPPPRPW